MTKYIILLVGTIIAICGIILFINSVNHENDNRAEQVIYVGGTAESKDAVVVGMNAKAESSGNVTIIAGQIVPKNAHVNVTLVDGQLVPEIVYDKTNNADAVREP